MGCMGNHESAHNFSHYINRFSHYNFIANPAGPFDGNWWYSWNFYSGGARVHIVSIDTEVWYDEAGSDRLAAQFAWIQSDLIAAYDSGDFDYIIAYGHRPMYCSNVDDMPDCSSDAQLLRAGQYGLERALSVRPVDLYIAGHQHSYERTWPVLNGTIDTTQTDVNVYVDPKFPVHLISGSGGCVEKLDEFDSIFFGPWSAFRSATYGYGHLTVHNKTHLHWEQLLDEGRSGLTDSLWIIKKSPRQRWEGDASSSMIDAE